MSTFSTACHPAGLDPSTLFCTKFVNGKMSISENNGGKTRTQHPVTTGTSVLGIKFDGGVAIAADMLGSYGALARYPGVSRLVKINSTTVLGASGDYADLQALKEELHQMMIQNELHGDGHEYTPEAIFSFLRMLMYHRRNKFDPLWNILVVAGYNDNKPFLGYIDIRGRDHYNGVRIAHGSTTDEESSGREAKPVES